MQAISLKQIQNWNAGIHLNTVKTILNDDENNEFTLKPSKSSVMCVKWKQSDSLLAFMIHNKMLNKLFTSTLILSIGLHVILGIGHITK